MSPFRGPKDRTRKLAEVGGHEKVGQHPRCVRLEQAWEEGGILYLQTELCGPSLQQHCEAWGASLPETQVWGYLRDTLLALAHLHGQGLVHLDVKPANIFLGPRGRCKLGDFGLLVELGASGTSEAQEGDPATWPPSCSRALTGQQQTCSAWASPSWRWHATWSCPAVGRAGSGCVRAICP